MKRPTRFGIVPASGEWATQSGWLLVRRRVRVFGFALPLATIEFRYNPVVAVLYAIGEALDEHLPPG